jgi:hypothetical protein
LYNRGRRNAANIAVKTNYVRSDKIPPSFDGFAILHVSDLHIDMSAKAMDRLQEILPRVGYDICVLTGDYRGQTFGPYQPALDGMAMLCKLLNKRPTYGAR